MTDRQIVIAGGVVGALGGPQLLPAVHDQADRDEQAERGDHEQQRHRPVLSGAAGARRVLRHQSPDHERSRNVSRLEVAV